ncbi:MAG TPA: YajQ family cyclic di-GMP-binding protein [Polyangiaceae bacterium]|jgi:uncharacterized protein YajQ (UPF0234 family)|nr:YajQ family cyclic di-GMP-binding protein [Polyangiaceae bacterium]
MPSFDVVSKIEWAEVANAINQAQKEIGQRFDFKGTDARLEQSDKVIWFYAKGEDRVRAAWQVLQEKLVRRKVSLKHFTADDPLPGPRGDDKLKVTVEEGIAQEKAKEIVRLLKDSKLKVQAAIQGDLVRVSGKKRDDLQEAIAHLRAADFKIDLQFINFRE